MEFKDKMYTVQGVEEMAKMAYRQGFTDGWDAAHFTVELMAQSQKAERMQYDAELVLKALDMSKDNAVEMLGRNQFSVIHMQVMDRTEGPEQ